MTFAWAVVLGFVLGLRHATDADHVVAVGTMLHREPSPLRAARLAVSWGLGHTLTFLALGLLIVVAEVRIPARFEPGAELAVGVMLMALGALTVRRVWRPTARVARWRPLLVGIVHGLAGSAGVALVALSTIASRAGALLYLALFCAGTVVGMIALTVVLSFPLGWSSRRYGCVPTPVILAGALLSFGLGVAMVLRSRA